AEQMLLEFQRYESGDFAIVRLPSAEPGGSQHLVDRSLRSSTEVMPPVDIKVANDTAPPPTEHVVESYSAESTGLSNNSIERSHPEEKNDPSESIEHDAFSLQISVHAVRFSAEQEMNFFRRHGIDSYIVERRDVDPVVPYWVCTGSFRDWQTAQNRMQDLTRAVRREYKIIEL
ncbi:hypothetical protein JW992_00290, partial [candidate division KSB1 bacterium]|nr:hypothetical protein [candidate division KSB1 bacterium]